MSESKEAKLKTLAHDAIRGLVTLNCNEHEAIVVDQCRRIAIDIANTIAPQLYGSRRHGENNAVSLIVKSCSEALFWLDFSEEDMSTVTSAVTLLRDTLCNPSLS